MAHRDSRTAIGRLDLPRIGEALAGGHTKTIDVPVMLIEFSKNGEENPAPTYPTFEFNNKVKGKGKAPISILTPADSGMVKYLKDKQKYGRGFRMTRKIARMTLADIEAHAIEEYPEYFKEVLINLKQPVVVENPRSGRPERLRTGYLPDFIELLDPDPENPDTALEEKEETGDGETKKPARGGGKKK